MDATMQFLLLVAAGIGVWGVAALIAKRVGF